MYGYFMPIITSTSIMLIEALDFVMIAFIQVYLSFSLITSSLYDYMLI